MSFGSNLRYYRIQKKLTLKDLSDDLKVSINYLSKLEQNKAKIYPDFLPKLCAVLHIEIVDLYQENLPDLTKEQ